MYVDFHCHIFTALIVKNVKQRPDMIGALHLNTDGAEQRLDPAALEESAKANQLDACVLLPTAGPDKVRAENDRFIQWTEQFPRLRCCATLHPFMSNPSDEILRMFDKGIQGFKFSSFSQRFDIASLEFAAMLTQIELLGAKRHITPTLVVATFAQADFYFGANPNHLTTPPKLMELSTRHQGLNVVGAHMGGLLADFEEVRRFLVPTPNLYLDTANAGHTLKEDEFVELLRSHGPGNIVFGTDWPWFHHASEKARISSLLTKAGYTQSDSDRVFGGNAERLLGLCQKV
jgi:uncharacterized protein